MRWVCHWSPRMRIGKRTSAASIAARARTAGGQEERGAGGDGGEHQARAGEEAAQPVPFAVALGATSRSALVQADRPRHGQRAPFVFEDHPQPVAAGRLDDAGFVRPVPVVGVVAVALEEGVAGELGDDFAARPDHLDRRLVGGGGAKLQPDPRQRRRERVGLFPPTLTRSTAAGRASPVARRRRRRGGDDQQREDDRGGVNLLPGHCPRRPRPRLWRRSRPPETSAFIGSSLAIDSSLATSLASGLRPVLVTSRPIFHSSSRCS